MIIVLPHHTDDDMAVLWHDWLASDQKEQVGVSFGDGQPDNTAYVHPYLLRDTHEFVDKRGGCTVCNTAKEAKKNGSRD